MAIRKDYRADTEITRDTMSGPNLRAPSNESAVQDDPFLTNAQKMPNLDTVLKMPIAGVQESSSLMPVAGMSSITYDRNTLDAAALREWETILGRAIPPLPLYVGNATEASIGLTPADFPPYFDLSADEVIANRKHWEERFNDLAKKIRALISRKRSLSDVMDHFRRELIRRIPAELALIAELERKKNVDSAWLAAKKDWLQSLRTLLSKLMECDGLAIDGFAGIEIGGRDLAAEIANLVNLMVMIGIAMDIPIKVLGLKISTAELFARIPALKLLAGRPEVTRSDVSPQEELLLENAALFEWISSAIIFKLQVLVEGRTEIRELREEVADILEDATTEAGGLTPTPGSKSAEKHESLITVALKAQEFLSLIDDLTEAFSQDIDCIGKLRAEFGELKTKLGQLRDTIVR